MIKPDVGGWLEYRLNQEELDYVWRCVNDKKFRWNNNLAGNIESSFLLEDKDDWFFNNVLLYLIKQYTDEDLKVVVPAVLTKNCSYVLDTIWVNFQNKYEFNPVHCHQGVFSFVIWMEIPSSHKKEKKLKFVKESNSQCPNTFEFIFTNMLGAVCTERYYLEPEDKGTILLFPSKLLHQVYPFYLSNKKRISIAGNIKLDPTKII